MSASYEMLIRTMEHIQSVAVAPRKRRVSRNECVVVDVPRVVCRASQEARE